MRRSSVKKTITVTVFILAAAVLLSACGYTVVDTDRIGDFEATFDRVYNETVLDTACDGESFDMKPTTSESGGEIVGKMHRRIAAGRERSDTFVRKIR